jgi:hypothetical protein
MKIFALLHWVFIPYMNNSCRNNGGLKGPERNKNKSMKYKARFLDIVRLKLKRKRLIKLEYKNIFPISPTCWFTDNRRIRKSEKY